MVRIEVSGSFCLYFPMASLTRLVCKLILVRIKDPPLSRCIYGCTLYWYVTTLKYATLVLSANLSLILKASGYLIGTDVLRPDRKAYLQGNMTPSNTTATRLWQNSARTIGDILILSDIVNPFVYHALPFSNQPFVVAGCCYIKDADAQLRKSERKTNAHDSVNPDTDKEHTGANDSKVNTIEGSTGSEHHGADIEEEKAEMFRTLLQSVTSNNIAALRQGLIRQTRYWAGVAWVAEVLAQRMSGISMDDIDLKAVTESLDSTVATTDARMFTQSGDEARRSQQQPSSHAIDESSAWFDMPLSLETDWLADTTFLQSQGYPVVVEDFTSDWATNYA